MKQYKQVTVKPNIQYKGLGLVNIELNRSAPVSQAPDAAIWVSMRPMVHRVRCDVVQLEVLKANGDWSSQPQSCL